jgi:integrase
LRSYLPERLWPLVTFCYLSSVRKGEALSITWDQVNLEHREIILTRAQTKNGEARVPPLTDELVEMQQKRFRVGPVFPATNLVKAWRKAAKAAKLEGL